MKFCDRDREPELERVALVAERTQGKKGRQQYQMLCCRGPGGEALASVCCIWQLEGHWWGVLREWWRQKEAMEGGKWVRKWCGVARDGRAVVVRCGVGRGFCFNGDLNRFIC